MRLHVLPLRVVLQRWGKVGHHGEGARAEGRAWDYSCRCSAKSVVFQGFEYLHAPLASTTTVPCTVAAVTSKLVIGVNGSRVGGISYRYKQDKAKTIVCMLLDASLKGIIV